MSRPDEPNALDERLGGAGVLLWLRSQRRPERDVLWGTRMIKRDVT